MIKTGKNAKLALILGFASIFVCFAMLLGSTYAWFTDNVSSGINTIVVGNLDVELEYSTDMETWITVNSDVSLFDTENTIWEPGHTEVVYLRVSNVGSLALKYLLGVDVSHEDIGYNVAGDEYKLSDHIMYGIKENVTEPYADTERATAISDVKNLETKLNLTYSKEFMLNPKTDTVTDCDVFALVVYMPEGVANEANHDGDNIPKIEFGISVLATQTEAEYDSFGNNYDEGATYPVINVDETDDTVEN